MGETLKNLRRQSAMSQKKLAEALKVSQSAVAMWESGKNTPEYGTLLKLGDIFNVSIDYLTGQLRGREPKSIPVLGYVRAGVPTEATQEVLGYEDVYIRACDADDYFALRIQGDSMSPRMLEGDVVIVKRRIDCESGDICVAMINGGETTVKKLIKKDMSIILMPLNPAYDPIVFTSSNSSDIMILGKVVELRAKV